MVRVAVLGLALLLSNGRVFADEPSFLNEIEPLLTKLGCNQGACHGKAAGQNGFRLSLRGYAPEWDHGWLTREYASRRIHFGIPEASLILRKPLGEVPHEGGQLLQPGSREYQTLLAWIQAGAPGPKKNEATLKNIALQPGSQVVKVGQKINLKVEAEFSDGQRKDVTWLARFDSNDAAVAEVDARGLVTVVRPGETFIRASFLGLVAVVGVAAPHDQPVAAASFLKGNNVIDEHVFAKLKALHIEPAPLCADEVFLRRVYLDTLGILPSAAEVRTFLADKNPGKRGKLIDDVLARPEFVDFWTMQLDDLLQNRKESDHDVRGAKGVRTLHAWIRRQVQLNRPWDEMVRELLTAAGTTHDHPAIGYFIVNVGEQRHAQNSPVVAAVAQTFLGTRIGCAQCHNHPLEKYTQDDYYHFAGFFSRLRLERKEPKTGPTALLAVDPEYLKNKSKVGVNQPRTNQFLAPQPLDRTVFSFQPGDDPRQALAEWMTSPKNEYFAGAMVNRLWKHFFAVGLVEPVDDLRASNPPTNPELWQALVREFVAKKFDRKHLMRLILNCRAYQLASNTTPANEKDTRFFSHYYVRRLPAEILLDAISQCTGVPEQFEGYPIGLRSVQVPDPAVKSYFLSAFGKSDRITACACERNSEVTLPQVLHMLGGIATGPKITHPEGRLRQLVSSKMTDAQIVEEIYLAALSRLPGAAERKLLEDTLTRGLQEGGSRDEIFRDIFWAVLNTREFVFNH